MVTTFNTRWITALNIDRTGGELVSIHAKFFDAPLDYNLHPCQNWLYAMQFVASSIFQVVQFPFQGKIVIIDQLDFCSVDTNSNSMNNVPLLTSSAPQYQNIGVGILNDYFLMRVFPLNNPPPPS